MYIVNNILFNSIKNKNNNFNLTYLLNLKNYFLSSLVKKLNTSKYNLNNRTLYSASLCFFQILRLLKFGTTVLHLTYFKGDVANEFDQINLPQANQRNIIKVLLSFVTILK